MSECCFLVDKWFWFIGFLGYNKCEQAQKMKSKIIIIAVLVIFAIAGLVWYLQKGNKQGAPQLNQAKSQQQAPAPKEEGLGAEVYEKAQNPVKDEVPETNPIKNVKTNPFKEEYSNPFE